MKQHFVVAFFAFCVVCFGVSSAKSDPEENETLEQIVRSRGFELETHNVTTADGYFLTLHRLVYTKFEIDSYESNEDFYHYTIDRKPIILQHGLFGSSADFLISSPTLHTNDSECGDNLGFGLLLTNRYDVWLGNSRGNRYSRGRRGAPSIEDHYYWNFSFDQMAEYDTPATIDYVLNVTGKKTVGYVGFSQGTAMMFALLTLRPEYANIVQPFVAMAPVTTVAHIRSPIRYLSNLAFLMRSIGGEFLPSSPFVSHISKYMCHNSAEEFLCENMVFLFSGYDAKHLNRTRIPVYFNFLPSSASTWEIAHWAQLVQSKRFARFDYGSEAKNRKAYGTPDVPDFPLETIPSNTRIALFRGKNDFLSSIPDTDRLIRILTKNNVQFTDYVVPDPEWTHIDFILGTDAGRLVYDRVIEVLDKYTN